MTNDDTPENASFWKWTPCGSLKLSTINEDAAKQLEPGKYFYLDITPADQ